MKKNTLILSCLLMLFAVRINAQADTDNLTDAEKAYVLSKFNTEVKYNFVFYNELPFNWDSLCLAALPALLDTKSFDEYVDGLKRLCAELSDGHTRILADNKGGNSDHWLKPWPMKTKRVGDRVFVREVLNSGFQKQGLEEGCEVLQIDGMDVIDYVDRYKRPYTSSSTPQWLDYSLYNEFELTKDTGSKVSKILFKNRKGKTFTIESHRNVEWDIDSGSSVFEYKVLEGNTGLLKINIFMGNDFVREFNEIYKEIEKTDALIIDIRDNMGGNSGFADYIIRHLSNSPVKMGLWSSRMYVAAHGSWGYPQEWYMMTPPDLKPVTDKPIYTKPVAVLVNSSTFSSSENFCVTFRGMDRGKIIGMPTGGSTGNPIYIKLGYDISALICTKNEWDVAGNKFIGIGIIPDIEVEETADIFLNGKDVVIEAALRELGKM